MEVSDADVIRQVRGGDVDAYRTLVSRYYARCFRYALHMLGNRADAEDATQDAFGRAFRSLRTYREQRQFSSWLMQILVNQCRTLGDRQRRQRRRFVSLDDDDALLDRFSTTVDSLSEWRADLTAALARLAPDHREAILLKYVDDLTYEDIAAITGAQVSALKMRVKRGREHLEALLRERT